MTIDLRTHVPEWVKYAEFTDVNSDKFYEIRVDVEGTNVYLTKRFGRRPDERKGQIQAVQITGSRNDAIASARKTFEGKINKGYVETDWPFGTAAMPDFHNPQAVVEWLDA